MLCIPLEVLEEPLPSWVRTPLCCLVCRSCRLCCTVILGYKVVLVPEYPSFLSSRNYQDGSCVSEK